MSINSCQPGQRLEADSHETFYFKKKVSELVRQGSSGCDIVSLHDDWQVYRTVSHRQVPC
jgi:hypothetical protein